MLTRRIIIPLLLTFLSLCEMQAQTRSQAEQIKDFYACYMKAIETCNQKEENKLLQDFLTPEMQEKKGRLVQALTRCYVHKMCQIMADRAWRAGIWMAHGMKSRTDGMRVTLLV